MLFALGLMTFSPRLWSLPASEHSEGGIPFNNPTHREFFNYQVFLQQHGLVGETAESWGKLSQDKHVKRVRAGESFISKKLQELFSKKSLTSEDIDFIKTVYGDEFAATNSKARTALDKRLFKSEAGTLQGALLTRINKLGGSRADWNTVFDGSRQGGAIVAPVFVHGITRGRSNHSQMTGQGEWIQVNGNAVASPLSNRKAEPSHSKLPLTPIGAAILAGSGYALYLLKRRNSKNKNADLNEFDLDVRLGEGNDQFLVAGYSGNVGCTNTCSQSCGGSCDGSCGNSCGGTCGQGTCGGTCGDTCGNTCGDTCGNTCGDTCGGTCGHTCGCPVE
jgi:hypothetical protein